MCHILIYLYKSVICKHIHTCICIECVVHISEKVIKYMHMLNILLWVFHPKCVAAAYGNI